MGVTLQTVALNMYEYMLSRMVSAGLKCKIHNPPFRASRHFEKTEQIGTFFRTAEDRTKASSRPMRSATSSLK